MTPFLLSALCPLAQDSNAHEMKTVFIHTVIQQQHIMHISSALFCKRFMSFSPFSISYLFDRFNWFMSEV